MQFNYVESVSEPVGVHKDHDVAWQLYQTSFDACAGAERIHRLIAGHWHASLLHDDDMSQSRSELPPLTVHDIIVRLMSRPLLL